MNKIKFSQRRFFLDGFSLFLSVLILLPILHLFIEGISSLSNGVINLGADGAKQIKGTFLLVLLTSTTGGLLGTINGWILTNCRFKGRKILRLAQLLPLATPAYLLSAILIDIGSIYGIRINGMIWGVTVMTLTFFY